MIRLGKLFILFSIIGVLDAFSILTRYLLI
jgi:hypothetical protein